MLHTTWSPLLSKAMPADQAYTYNLMSTAHGVWVPVHVCMYACAHADLFVTPPWPCGIFHKATPRILHVRMFWVDANFLVCCFFSCRYFVYCFWFPFWLDSGSILDLPGDPRMLEKSVFFTLRAILAPRGVLRCSKRSPDTAFGFNSEPRMSLKVPFWGSRGFQNRY